MFREAAPQIGLTPAESTFVVQGYGNVGSWAARILQQLGAKMVGASDATGAIRGDAGIDADELAAHLREGGRLTEFPGTEVISPGRPARDRVRRADPGGARRHDPRGQRRPDQHAR